MNKTKFFKIRFIAYNSNFSNKTLYFYEKDGILREYYSGVEYRIINIGQVKYETESGTIYYEDNHALICDKYKLLHTENHYDYNSLIPDKEETLKMELEKNYESRQYKIENMTPEEFYKATKHFKFKEKQLERDYYKFIKSEITIIENRIKRKQEELKQKEENNKKQLEYESKILKRIKRR